VDCWVKSFRSARHLAPGCHPEETPIEAIPAVTALPWADSAFLPHLTRVEKEKKVKEVKGERQGIKRKGSTGGNKQAPLQTSTASAEASTPRKMKFS